MNRLTKTAHVVPGCSYNLALAMYPRILCTFKDDEEMTALNTAVRVGQAVDTVGLAGMLLTMLEDATLRVFV